MRGYFEDEENNVQRSIAIKKLKKLLGKSFTCDINPNAPTREERDKAEVELRAANAAQGSLGAQAEARRRAILGADAEYQRLTADYVEARSRSAELSSITFSYKIRVRSSNGLFSSVLAEGDSWEQVIDKLTKKQAS
jgi:hypothetical protein